jgi:DNA-directed RNA polymerase specialized sigma24 family protein
VTARKCSYWQDFFHTQRRDVTREAPQAAPAHPGLAHEIPGREETPSTVAILAETVEQVLAGFAEREQQIVLLSLQGHSALDVSRELGCTESKVYRVLREVRDRLERLRQQT